ncbi:hypothetical protein ACVDG8_024165 [Mesorhizobium sp. ORM8.1]
MAINDAARLKPQFDAPRPDMALNLTGFMGRAEKLNYFRPF